MCKSCPEYLNNSSCGKGLPLRKKLPRPPIPRGTDLSEVYPYKKWRYVNKAIANRSNEMAKRVDGESGQ